MTLDLIEHAGNPMQNAESFVHEHSYAGLLGISHRSRLTAFLRILRELELSDAGEAVDFGCSNGFIIEVLRRHQLPGCRWHLTGVDHSRELLALAREKHLPNVVFTNVDLNKAHDLGGRFDLVFCLETLEHVGNYKAAIETLVNACKPGGRIVISVPYEKALPGLVKYAARKAVRRNAFGDFFKERSEFAYLWALLRGKSICHFRYPARTVWGPHFGFDNEVFEADLISGMGRCTLLLRRSNFFGFNMFYVFGKRST
jgi:2-polyprenyl-3-methyl-5-hydroxy-6-metoxy-1,4-benzoquinol methylase